MNEIPPIISFFFALIGIFTLLNITYKLQLAWGNFLYKMQYEKKLHKNLNWLRKIWWSEFDFYRDYDFERAFIEAYKLKNK